MHSEHTNLTDKLVNNTHTLQHSMQNAHNISGRLHLPSAPVGSEKKAGPAPDVIDEWPSSLNTSGQGRREISGLELLGLASAVVAQLSTRRRHGLPRPTGRRGSDCPAIFSGGPDGRGGPPLLRPRTSPGGSGGWGRAGLRPRREEVRAPASAPPPSRPTRRQRPPIQVRSNSKFSIVVIHAAETTIIACRPE